MKNTMIVILALLINGCSTVPRESVEKYTEGKPLGKFLAEREYVDEKCAELKDDCIDTVIYYDKSAVWYRKNGRIGMIEGPYDKPEFMFETSEMKEKRIKEENNRKLVKE